MSQEKLDSVMKRRDQRFFQDAEQDMSKPRCQKKRWRVQRRAEAKDALKKREEGNRRADGGERLEGPRNFRAISRSGDGRADRQKWSQK